MRARSKFLDGSSRQGHVSKTMHVLKETQEPTGDRDLVQQDDKEALFEMQGHPTHVDYAPPTSSNWTFGGHVFQASWTLEC